MLVLTLAWLTTARAAPSVDLVLTRAADAQRIASVRLDRRAPWPTEDTLRKAAAGTVVTGVLSVEGQVAKKAWGVAVVDAPISRFWAAINDDAHKAEWTPLDYAEVLSGKVCEAPRRVFQYVPIPLLTDRWWVMDVRYNTALATQTGGRIREQTWATNGDFTVTSAAAKAWADKGMHVTATTGSWLLVDLDGTSTLVEYNTWADPGGSVPLSLVNSIATSGIDDTFAAMTAFAKKGPGCPIW